MIRKKIFPETIYLGYKLYDADGDTSKKWYIWNTKGKTRKRRYGNINDSTSLIERYLAAKDLIDKLHKNSNLGRLSISKQKMIDVLEDRKRRKKWSKKTYQGHKSKLLKFLRFHVNKDITPSSVADFFYGLQTNVNDTTNNSYYIAISSLMNHAKLPTALYFEDVERVRCKSKPYLFFSKQQHQAIKQEVIGTDMYYHILFIYFCFIRNRSELTLLKESDILIDEQRILMRSEVSKNRCQEFAIIPDAFVPELKKYLATKKKSIWLFPSPKDALKPVSKDVFNRKHQKILKRLNIDTNLHKLYSWKHTGAKNFLEAGGTVLELCRMMRHKDISTTMGYLRDIGAEQLLGTKTKFKPF